MSRASRSSSLRPALTLSASLLLHVGVLGALTHQSLAAADAPAALRFSGNSFEIDLQTLDASAPLGSSTPSGLSDSATEANDAESPEPSDTEPPQEPSDTEPAEPSDTEPPQEPAEAQPQSTPTQTAPAATPAVPKPAVPKPALPKPAVPPSPASTSDAAASSAGSSASPGATDSANSPDGTGAAEGSSPGAAQYGQNGSGTRAIDLYSAFLKTLPLAAKSNAAWKSLPLGPAGKVRFTVVLDEQQHLQPIVVATSLPDGSVPSPELAQAVTRNYGFLHLQQYSLSNAARKQGAAGEFQQSFELSAVVSQASADPQTPEADGIVAFGLLMTGGDDTPSGTFFQYFDGRRIDVSMRRVP